MPLFRVNSMGSVVDKNILIFCAYILHKKFVCYHYDEVMKMLLKFTIENFEVFQKPVELSMEANLHTRKFLSNVVQSDQGNALKSIAIYGPNNTGKTCTIEAISAYRNVLLNRPFRYSANVFSESTVVNLGAEFLSD